jgi:hypothetical protein
MNRNIFSALSEYIDDSSIIYIVCCLLQCDDADLFGTFFSSLPKYIHDSTIIYIVCCLLQCDDADLFRTFSSSLPKYIHDSTIIYIVCCLLKLLSLFNKKKPETIRKLCKFIDIINKKISSP